jgi:CRISPR-associated protein (TIGR03986 family)
VPDHYRYPFFTAGMNPEDPEAKPVIPGSEIRGAVRSIYETITNSCFGSMKADTTLTSRVTKPFQPGVLKLMLFRDGHTEWKLYEAKRWLVLTDPDVNPGRGVSLYKTVSTPEGEFRIQDRSGIPLKTAKGNPLRTGSVVHFEKDRGNPYIHNPGHVVVGSFVRTITTNPADPEGILCLGEEAPKRHFHSIFEQISSVPVRAAVGAEDFRKMEDVLSIYRDSAVNTKLKDGSHKGYRDYEKCKDGGRIPVYYSLDAKGKVYLSFAALGRRAYHRSLNDAAGGKSHQLCSGRDRLCPACQLFGTVEGEGAGSRIRFTDAVCENSYQEAVKRNVLFDELGAPRNSYVPFYLHGKNGAAGTDTAFAEGYDSPDLELNGRKFYWHHTPDLNFRLDNMRQSDWKKKMARCGTFDVVKADEDNLDQNRFSFQIFFEGITEDQLKLLCTSLNLGENRKDGDLCIKLGHGKPLGYGSCKLVVDGITQRTFSQEMGWKESPLDVPEEMHTCSEGSWKDLQKICSLHACDGLDVRYPYVFLSPDSVSKKADQENNDLAGHHWFSENYRVGRRPPLRTLPKTASRDQTLPAVKADYRK